MATRCLIGKVLDEVKEPYYMVKYIYCHFDGYPEGVGKCLRTNYIKPRKINTLFNKGDLVSLGSKLKDKMKSNTEIHTQFSEDSEDHELIPELTYGNKIWLKENWDDIEYLYLYKNSKWYCKGWDSDKFMLV